MPLGRMLSLCALALLLALTLGESVNLGESVTFTAREECSRDGGFKLIHLLQKDARSQDVARLISGVWMPVDLYKDRIRHESTRSVVLTDVNIRDEGSYEFSCSGSMVGLPIQLEVVVPVDRSVAAGGEVKLPCFSSAAVKTVRWEKDAGLVFEQDQPSKLKLYGKGFLGRASVSPDDAKGDFSLTLDPVKLQDQGVYICNIYDEDGTWSRGGPAAVRLMVTGNGTGKRTDEVEQLEGATQPSNTTSQRTDEVEWLVGATERSNTTLQPTPSVTEDKDTPIWAIIGKISVAVFVIQALVLVPVLWLLKSRCSWFSSGSGGGSYSGVATVPPNPPQTNGVDTAVTNTDAESKV